MKRKRIPTFVVALAVALAVGGVFAGSAGAQQESGTVTVVHGVPDLPVDVYVNGEPTLTNFQPTTVTDPLTLPAGDYEITIFPAGTDPTAEPAISGSATLPPGANASIVAHLTEGGDPTLTVFVNDTSQIAAGQARATVRHTAAAPAVDVRANGNAIVTGLSNPNEATTPVPPGTVAVDVVPAGGADPVIGPVDLTFAEGTSTIAYAIGSLDQGTLDVVVQTIGGLHSAPAGVPTGSGGLAADEARPWWPIALVLAGGLGVLLLGAHAVRVRRQPVRVPS